MKPILRCRLVAAWALMAAALVAAPLNYASPPAVGDWPGEVVFIGGVDNLRQVDKQAFGTIRVENRASFHGFRPFAHVGLAHAGSLYGGAGVLYEFRLSRATWLTLGSGPGVYRHKGNDPDLGCAVEFASWVEVSTWIKRHRVGITFGHLSNAHLGSRNPGTETLGLTLHFPCNRR